MTLDLNRRTIRGAIAAASVIALVGCSQAAAPATTSSGPQNLSGSTFSMGVPVTESGDSPYKLIADAYMKAYPDRKVTINELPGDGFAQALRTQLQAGNAPDLVYVTPGGGNPQALLPFAQAGYVDALDAPGAASTVAESSKPLFYLDNKLYAQALDLTVVSSVSNKSAMDKDGVTFPTTYSGMLDTCKSVAAKGKSLYAVAGAMPPNTGLMAMVVAGAKVYADDPTWDQKRVANQVTFADSQGWKDALNAVVEMKDAGCFQKGVEGGDFAAITNGLGTGTSYAGFIPSGAAFQLETNVKGSEFVVRAFPGQSADKALIYASSNNALSLTSASKNKDAAKAFLEWLAQPENLKAYAKASGNLPVGEISASDLPPEYEPVAEMLTSKRYVVLPNQAWPNGEVYTALGTGLQGLFTGQTTVDDVLKAMDDAWAK